MEKRYVQYPEMINKSRTTTFINKETKPKNACVIAGGGALGAFTIGRLAKLDKDYDYFVGCSTGAMIAPLAALKKWDRLKEAYTSVTQEKIFNVNPFKENGNIKVLQSLFRLLCGKKTIGENQNLKKTISEFFTLEDYNEILASNKEVLIAVCNLTDKDHCLEYKSIRDYSYEKFTEYMWASASIPLVCSLVEIDGKIYADGGLCEVTPLLKAVEMGSSSIDCFLHQVEKELGKRGQINNFFHLLSRTYNVMRKEITDNDLLMIVLKK
jgi:predicted acylesterase/phospholipase RssA